MTGKTPTLLILGIRGIPAAHGGFETFAERLALWLVGRGWKIVVYCQGSLSGRIERDVWQGIDRVHIPVKRDGPIGTIEFDIKATAHAARHEGLILTLGYNTGFLSTWLRLRGRVNYINMDGLEWKRAKYSRPAKAFLWVNERLAAWAGTVLIADHPVIADHLATRVRRRKIITIPYGADRLDDPDPATLAPLGLEPGRFLTAIARPEPENSLLEIVTAFSARPRGVTLAILGRYDRAVPYQAAVLDAAGPEVVFPGAIYERERLAALRFHSVAYLHGHRVGGTNPSLVESLGAGNAMILHDNPFNRWVAGNAGLYFADADECERHITVLLADEALRARLAAAARRRWTAEFSWPNILQQYQAMLEPVPVNTTVMA